MKRNMIKWFGVVVMLSMLLAVAPAALAGPAEQDPNINPTQAKHALVKTRDSLRVPAYVDVLRMLRENGGLPIDATEEEISDILDAWYRDFNSKNPDGADPRELQKRREALNQYLVTGEPQAAAQTVEEKATLVAVVDFSGPDTVTRLWPDPADPSTCTEQTFTWEGPAFGETPAPGPLDNFHLWRPTWTAADYEQLYFGVGPDAGIGIARPDLGGIDLTGLTMANYVLEQSGGTHTPLGQVLDTVLTLPHSHGYYGAAYATQTEDGCVITDNSDGHGFQYYLDAIAAVQAAYPDLDYSQFDTDGDRTVDLFAVIHAGWDWQTFGGVDALATSSTSFINHNEQPMQVAGTDTPDDPSDDYFINGLNMLPEHLDVGAIAEEYEHQFGLPDFYTSDGSNSNAWWASHSSGVWGGPLGGTRPVGHALWQDVFLGWRAPVVINYDDPSLDVILGQARYTPAGTEDGLVINLPPITNEQLNPLDTGIALWGGKTDQHNSTLTRGWDLSTATGQIIFSVASWWDMEEDWDYGFFEVSTDGATWTTLPDMDGYTTDTNPNSNNLGWGLTYDGEDTLRFDLSAYAGQTMLYTRLVQFNDAAVHYAGWYIDDIAVTVDGTAIYSQDFEGDYSDWTNVDWIEVPFTAEYPQAYFVEWRTKIGFDQSLADPYYPVYNNDETAEFVVDRLACTTPGMQLSYYNGQQDFDYAIDDASFDEPPSTGPKFGHLVVESHYWPYRFDTTFSWFQDGLVGYTMYGRTAAGDALFGLVPTEEWTARLGYDQDGNYTWPPVEVKTFESRPAVRNFHDYLGYYPGYFYPGFGGYVYLHDWDASAVIPADPEVGEYSTRITWPDGTPFPQLYGTWGILGDGNPGSWGAELGVNLCVQDQAADGTSGKVQFNSFKYGERSAVVADTLAPLPGGTVEFAVTLENLRGGSQFFVFVPLGDIPGDLDIESLTNGAFPVWGDVTSAQVSAMYDEGGLDAVRALAENAAAPFAGIAWIGEAKAGLNELFRFGLSMQPWAAGAQFDIDADFYMCGDYVRTLFSEPVTIQIPEPVTVVLPAAQDSFVDAWAPDDNRGASNAFSVRQPGVMNALLYFGNGAIPQTATVEKATLKLYSTYRTNSNDGVLAIKKLSGVWSEEDVTWNTAPAAGDTTYATVVLTTVGEQIDIDVTALVQEWISDPWNNFGLLIAGEGSKSVQYDFIASEFGREWPVLEITYH
jgi:immune inhibitor A